MTKSVGFFLYLMRVRYSECDAQGVVFNARYGEYVDTAMTEYLRCTIGGYQALLAQNLDSQIVKQTTQWRNPARFDDVIACGVRVLSFGRSSYVVETELRDYGKDKLLALTESVYVMLNRETFCKTDVPAAMREQLAGPRQSIIINHAGIDIEGAG